MFGAGSRRAERYSDLCLVLAAEGLRGTQKCSTAASYSVCPGFISGPLNEGLDEGRLWYLPVDPVKYYCSNLKVYHCRLLPNTAYVSGQQSFCHSMLCKTRYKVSVRQDLTPDSGRQSVTMDIFRRL